MSMECVLYVKQYCIPATYQTQAAWRETLYIILDRRFPLDMDLI